MTDAIKPAKPIAGVKPATLHQQARREARLAAALRENLLKRKQQDRARRDPNIPPTTGDDG